jgi:hypothetical protein
MVTVVYNSGSDVAAQSRRRALSTSGLTSIGSDAASGRQGCACWASLASPERIGGEARAISNSARAASTS